VTRRAAGSAEAEAGGVPRRGSWLAGLIRDRAAAGTASLFSHGAHPLARTLDYSGDPGLFGPGSMTWPVAGDTAVFVGGIRALLVQAAHPEVAAGVAQHSRYREDPLGRLTRTAAYVTATSFGAMPEVSRAAAIVRGRHRPVRPRTDHAGGTAQRPPTARHRCGAVRVGGQPPPPGAVAGLRPGHRLPAPPPAPARHPPRLPHTAASRRGDPAPPPPADHRPAIPARRPDRRPGRGDHAAVGTGILTRLAAGAGPRRRHTTTARAVPPATAHDRTTA
jgi:hypothetical protein